MAPLLAKRRFFPSNREIAELGGGGLARAVQRYGGAAHWAAEFKMPLSPGQDRSRFGEDEALAEARQVLRELGYLPGADRLRELGRHRLASHLELSGGSRAFCIRHKDDLFR